MQYKTAAENALHFCYRNSLRFLKEEGLRTMVITCIYSKRKVGEQQERTQLLLRIHGLRLTKGELAEARVPTFARCP